MQTKKKASEASQQNVLIAPLSLQNLAHPFPWWSVAFMLICLYVDISTMWNEGSTMKLRSKEYCEVRIVF